MSQAIQTSLAAMLCAWLLAGCGGQPEAKTPPPAKAPAPAANVSLPAASLTAPPDIAAPPPPGAPATTAVAARADDKMVDAQGKALTSLQFVQQAVDFYDQSKDLLFPRKEESDPSQAPELTDLSLLVKAKVLKKLPDAAPGKKFHLDPKTHRVSLVSQ